MQAVKPTPYSVVSYATMHPKVWLEAVDTHIAQNNLTINQWQGLRDALSDLFLTYDATHHAKFENFSSAVDALKNPIQLKDKQQLQALLAIMFNTASFPDLTMIRYGNYLRDLIFAPVKNLEELNAQNLKKLEVACLLVSSEMGFSKAEVEHAEALIGSIKDASEGQLARVKAAAATLFADFNYSSVGPTKIAKMWNWAWGQ